ncbi:MAG: tetratricopeptide repeat protein [Candidatus Methanoperedenaceae archaeon]|nr:tetratricopeptide repeat protein [Candidatus Methanoperedenaceae archaeon]
MNFPLLTSLLSTIHQSKGEYDEALEKYRHSMEIEKKLCNLRDLAYTLAQMGLLYSHTGKKEEAIESTQKALIYLKKLDLKMKPEKQKPR